MLLQFLLLVCTELAKIITTVLIYQPVILFYKGYRKTLVRDMRYTELCEIVFRGEVRMDYEMRRNEKKVLSKAEQ